MFTPARAATSRVRSPSSPLSATTAYAASSSAARRASRDGTADAGSAARVRRDPRAVFVFRGLAGIAGAGSARARDRTPQRSPGARRGGARAERDDLTADDGRANQMIQSND